MGNGSVNLAPSNFQPREVTRRPPPHEPPQEGPEDRCTCPPGGSGGTWTKHSGAPTRPGGILPAGCGQRGRGDVTLPKVRAVGPSVSGSPCADALPPCRGEGGSPSRTCTLHLCSLRDQGAPPAPCSRLSPPGTCGGTWRAALPQPSAQEPPVADPICRKRIRSEWGFPGTC